MLGGAEQRGRELEIRTERRVVAPRSANQAAYLRALDSHDLVFALGPAGTGKTYLAVAAAVALLRQSRVERIVLSRPAVEAGERLGFETGQIEIAPLAYMRGRTLNNAVVILDEAQNTTPSQMKMFLTRLGENSHMVVTGDPTQSDLPAGMPSGLADAVGKLEGVPGIAVVRFDQGDIVRHPLVSAIIHAYEAAQRAAG
jgi:phosphate starvation-inducible PhoH-like protein